MIDPSKEEFYVHDENIRGKGSSYVIPLYGFKKSILILLISTDIVEVEVQDMMSLENKDGSSRSVRLV